MDKWRVTYSVDIGLNVVKDGEEIDYHTESYDFDTYEDAIAEANKHHIGNVEGEYSDGAEAVVDMIEVVEHEHEGEHCDDRTIRLQS